MSGDSLSCWSPGEGLREDQGSLFVSSGQSAGPVGTVSAGSVAAYAVKEVPLQPVLCLGSCVTSHHHLCKPGILSWPPLATEPFAASPTSMFHPNDQS